MTEYAVTVYIMTDVDIGLDMIKGAIADAINTRQTVYDCVER